jgi:predicted membrane protein
MCLSHGILFKTKFLGEKKYLTAKVDKLMMAPYKRIILIHLVISGIGLLLLTYNADSFLIVILFISAKILFDIYVFKKKPKKEML